MHAGDARRILVVDDEDHVRRALSDFLTFRGYDVRTAHSGEHALRVLKHFMPDLITLDINMPGMGGVGFLKSIMTPGGRLRYPVLVITVRATMQEFMSEIDVHGFLPKPCGQDDIESEIERILAQEVSGAAQAPTRHAPRVLVGDDSGRAEEWVTPLKQAGYEVLVALTGADVLDEAPRFRPDAILLKQTLPGIDGGHIAPILAVMPSTRNVPVLLYDLLPRALANGADGDRLPHGMTRYVPVSNGEGLLQAVREALS